MPTTTKKKGGARATVPPPDETKSNRSLPAADRPANPPPTAKELDALRSELSKAEAALGKVDPWAHDKLDRARAKVAEVHGRLDVAELTAMPLPASTVAALKFVERDVPAAAIRLTGNHRELHDDLATARLARSIQVLGLQQRIGLRDAGDGTFELIWGHRRLAANQMLGRAELPAKVFPRSLTPADVELLRTIENFGRKELTHVERAIAVARTLDAIEQTLTPFKSELEASRRNVAGEPGPELREHARSFDPAKVWPDRPDLVAGVHLSWAIHDAGGLHEYVGLQLGYPPKWVTDNAYVSKLGGEARQLLAAHRIDVGHARELAKLGDPEVADNIARMVARDAAGLRGETVERCRQLVMDSLRSLRSVPWRLDVAFGAGKPGCTGQACATCRFNSKSDPDLFGGALADEPAAGVCTNEACFKAKQDITAKDIKQAAAKAVKRSGKDDGFTATERTMTELVPLHVKPASAARVAKKEVEAAAPKADQAENGGARVSSDTPVPGKPARSPEDELEAAFREWERELSPILEDAALADPLRLAALAILDAHPAFSSYDIQSDQDLAKVADLIDAAGRSDLTALARATTAEIAKSKYSWARNVPVMQDASGEFMAAMADKWGVRIPPRPTLADFDGSAKQPPAEPGDDGPGETLPDDDDDDPPPTSPVNGRGGGKRASSAAAAKKAKLAESRDAAAPAAVRAYVESLPEDDRPLAWRTWNWLTTREAPDPLDGGGDPLTFQTLALALAELAQSAGRPIAEDRAVGPVFDVRRCRVCGCTDDDCSQCVEKTGEPCSWVEQDLCSACVPVTPVEDGASLGLTEDDCWRAASLGGIANHRDAKDRRGPSTVRTVSVGGQLYTVTRLSSDSRAEGATLSRVFSEDEWRSTPRPYPDNPRFGGYQPDAGGWGGVRVLVDGRPMVLGGDGSRRELTWPKVGKTRAQMRAVLKQTGSVELERKRALHAPMCPADSPPYMIVDAILDRMYGRVEPLPEAAATAIETTSPAASRPARLPPTGDAQPDLETADTPQVVAEPTNPFERARNRPAYEAVPLAQVFDAASLPARLGPVYELVTSDVAASGIRTLGLLEDQLADGVAMADLFPRLLDSPYGAAALNAVAAAVRACFDRPAGAAATPGAELTTAQLEAAFPPRPGVCPNGDESPELQRLHGSRIGPPLAVAGVPGLWAVTRAANYSDVVVYTLHPVSPMPAICTVPIVSWGARRAEPGQASRPPEDVPLHGVHCTGPMGKEFVFGPDEQAIQVTRPVAEARDYRAARQATNDVAAFTRAQPRQTRKSGKGKGAAA